MIAKGLRRTVRRIWRLALRVAFWAVVFAVGAVVLFRWLNPPLNYFMAREWVRLGSIEREWVPIEAMSVHLPLSAAAAEDADFCAHVGFDLEGIRAALADSTRLRLGSYSRTARRPGSATATRPSAATATIAFARPGSARYCSAVSRSNRTAPLPPCESRSP